MIPLRPIANSLMRSMPVLLTILFIIILFGVWTYGESWSFDQFARNSTIDKNLVNYASFGSRLAVTVFILLIISLFFIYKLVAKNQEIRTIQKTQEEEQEKNDATLPYIKDQEEVLNIMANTLKESIGSRDFLYKLPWYLLIGADDAGKTSFVNRSNQKFTLTEVERSSKRYQRSQSNYQINWWASDEAILIDPDGALFMQQNDKQQKDSDADFQVTVDNSTTQVSKPIITKALWEHLVAWLDKSRPKRPLNGIILVIDFPKLIGTSNSDRKALAILMRSRIRELMEQFGARLPVYVILNKFDLLEGFSVFYNDLDKHARQENLGFSFSLNTESNIDEWINEFEQNYLQFTQEIEEVVFDRLANTIDKSTRESLYMFVRELAGLREILLQFICDVLESDRFSTTPYVRGVYFSSVFQQGIPTDFYQTALSKQFNIPYVLPTVTPENEQKAYFSYDFFKRVVYPEAGLVSDNEKVTQQINKKRLQLSISLGLFSLALIAGWHFYYRENTASANRVLELTKEFSTLPKNNTVDYTGKKLLKPLNLLREATFEFGHYKEAWPVVEDLGLYQGREIGEKLDKVYAQFLSERFLPELAQGLIREMERLPNSSDKGLEVLRVYRMIDDIKNRKVNITNQWMANYWQRQFPNDGELQHQLMRHFSYAMDNVDPDLSAYDYIITQKQNDYRNVPLANRVYRSLKVAANNELNPPTNLRNDIGSAFDIVYQTPEDIVVIDSELIRPFSVFRDESASMEGVILSPLFTDWAYIDYYAPKADNVLELAMIDSWVLGQKNDINYSKEDLMQLEESVRNLYLSDYINTWRQAINSLDIVHFKDVAHAEQVLESIIGTAQPLQNLVKTVRKNSQIYPPIKETDTVARNNLLKDKNRAAAMKVTNEFSALSNIIRANEEKPSYIDEVMKYVRDLHAYLKSISNSVEPGQAALKTVTSELRLEKASPITTLRRVSTGLPAPLDKQLSQIADNAWQVVLTAALEELEVKWQENVYDFYLSRIANKYPFSPKSKANVSIEDFQSFFGRDGRLQVFYDTYLKLFLEDNKEVLSFEDSGSIVKSDFLAGLQDAWDIQDAFFDSTGRLGVQFALRPLGLSEQYRTASMNIDGQIVKYNHGRSFASKLIWPNTIRDNIESKLTVVTRQGKSRVMRRTGSWSWFKILDRAKIIARADQSIDLRFNIGKQGAMVYRLTAEDTNNPFIRTPFQHFSLPETLLSNSHTE